MIIWGGGRINKHIHWGWHDRWSPKLDGNDERPCQLVKARSPRMTLDCWRWLCQGYISNNPQCASKRSQEWNHWCMQICQLTWQAFKIQLVKSEKEPFLNCSWKSRRSLGGLHAYSTQIIFHDGPSILEQWRVSFQSSFNFGIELHPDDLLEPETSWWDKNPPCFSAGSRGP